jgi:hypothetical protein
VLAAPNAGVLPPPKLKPPLAAGWLVAAPNSPPVAAGCDVAAPKPPKAGVLAAGVAAAPKPPAPKGEGLAAAPNAGATMHNRQHRAQESGKVYTYDFKGSVKLWDAPCFVLLLTDCRSKTPGCWQPILQQSNNRT